MPDEPRQQPHLEVDFRHRIGSLSMDVRFRTNAPWTVLFGASGSGKSTILRVVAGLEYPEQGRLSLGAFDLGYRLPVGPLILPPHVLFDSKKGLSIPSHRRSVRMATQQAWLNKRSVSENVFWAARWKDREEYDEKVLSIFQLTDSVDEDVRQLSGGQRQRVSIARAVAAAIAPADAMQVRLLLLDEPFAGMDAALRDRLVPELKALLEMYRVPVISVTHDVGEAFLLGAEVVRIADGRVVEQGPVEDVLAEERKRLLGLLK